MGRQEWASGGCYEGDFFDDHIQGFGTMDYGDGDLYIGLWDMN